MDFRAEFRLGGSRAKRTPRGPKKPAAKKPTANKPAAKRPSKPAARRASEAKLVGPAAKRLSRAEMRRASEAKLVGRASEAKLVGAVAGRPSKAEIRRASVGAERVRAGVEASLKTSEAYLAQTKTGMQKVTHAIAGRLDSISQKRIPSKRVSKVQSRAEASRFDKVNNQIAELNADYELIASIRRLLEAPDASPQIKLEYVKLLNEASKRFWGKWDKVRLVILGLLGISAIGLSAYALYQFPIILGSLAELTGKVTSLVQMFGSTSFKIAAGIACAAAAAALAFTVVGVLPGLALGAICATTLHKAQ